MADRTKPLATDPPSHLRLDDRGRALPPSEEERKERSRRLAEALRRWEEDPPAEDPEGDAEFLKAIDSHRPEDRKLFEGYY
jgi:hypothetical protein